MSRETTAEIVARVRASSGPTATADDYASGTSAHRARVEVAASRAGFTIEEHLLDRDRARAAEAAALTSSSRAAEIAARVRG